MKKAAWFVRRAIRQAIPATGQALWMRFAGLVETGDPESSRTIDEIVYVQKTDCYVDTSDLSPSSTGLTVITRVSASYTRNHRVWPRRPS